MIKVKNITNDEIAQEVEYDDVESFLEDYIDDDIIQEWLNDLYEEVNIPIIGKIPVGDLLHSLREQGYEVFWDDIVMDYLSFNVEDIEYELMASGATYWGGYEIRDPEF